MAACIGAFMGCLNFALTINVQKSKVMKCVWLPEILVADHRKSNPYELPMPICHGYATLSTK